jgi:hypothetical protein
MDEQQALNRLLPKNNDCPHKAIIYVSAEVHEVTKLGEFSGMSKYTVEKFPVVIQGNDLNITIRKVNEFLERIKNEFSKA